MVTIFFIFSLFIVCPEGQIILYPLCLDVIFWHITDCAAGTLALITCKANLGVFSRLYPLLHGPSNISSLLSNSSALVKDHDSAVDCCYAESVALVHVFLFFLEQAFSPFWCLPSGYPNWKELFGWHFNLLILEIASLFYRDSIFRATRT